MSLPVDIPAVVKAATNIEDAAKEPIAVSLYIDDSAPDELIGHVRQAFASAGHNVRISVSYIDDENANISPNDDMAVIVAGTADYVGAVADRLRGSGVPVMVATTMPALVGDMAASTGHPIPEADIVYPVASKGILANIPFLKRPSKEQDQLTEDDEPITLDDQAKGLLDARMGEWIIAACSERKLAFAIAFPFVRRPLSEDAISATSMQNAAVGFVPIIPGADMPIMTLNQVKMVMQIAVAYGEKLDAARLKELAAVIGSAFIWRNIARSVAKFVPGIGWVVSGTVGFTGTQAIGHAAIEYFEAGGNLTGLANVVQNAAAEAADIAKKAASSSVGQRAIDAARSAMKGVVSAKRAKKA